MMSGGDYDGDMAWVCWNKELLRLILWENPAEDIRDIKDRASTLGRESAWSENSREREIKYVLKFRHHHATLGSLSRQLDAAIDQHGFDSVVARELGRALFLQVDVPDTRTFRFLKSAGYLSTSLSSFSFTLYSIHDKTRTEQACERCQNSRLDDERADEKSSNLL